MESFDEMNLREELLRGIYAYGFERPSAIQQRAILPCVEGNDVIAQAQSGWFRAPRILTFPELNRFRGSIHAAAVGMPCGCRRSEAFL